MYKLMKKILSPVLILLCFYQIFAQETNLRTLRGKVVDENGLPVTGAEVKILSDSGEIRFCRDENEGKFTCETDFNEGFSLSIEAKGFSILRQNFSKLQDIPLAAVFTLSPSSISAEVVITANRAETRLGETAASIVALSREEIQTSAAPTIDDVLRQAAGFSLFRRSGSRFANPTSQGVSLRGVGASGASRSLVLFDGVPLNDVFGGWVQWNRISQIAVERIEVLRGGASSLYGNNSLSGAINILPRKTRGKFAFSAEIFGGTQRSFSGGIFFGFKKAGWTADFVAASFQTKGYVLADERERGAIDSFAGSRNQNLSARIEKSFGDKANVFFKTAYFSESRTNGTPAQINRTHLRQFISGGEIQQSAFNIQNLKFGWRVFGGTQVYDQTFSAVNTARNSETLNRLQRVPAQNSGFTGQLSGVLFKNQTIVLGIEARSVRGASDEIGFVNNRASTVTGSGGREKTFSFFVQDFARFGSRFVLAASGRFDSWKNFHALSSSRAFSGNQTTITIFPNRSETAFSPQVSALFQVNENFSLHAVFSNSFRAPTLNELYRSFRVGNVFTLANENLRAEKAINFETGFSFNKDKIYLRGNFFFTEISQPIANVTLSAAPDLITRQRQNIGKTRSRGAEVEAEIGLKNFNLSIGYLFADSRVQNFPANRNLENLFVPQVARHQLTFQTRFKKGSWTFTLQVRAASRQFDDDQNLFRLEPYFQIDFFAAKKINQNLQVFFSSENIFNSRYSVGRTPVRTLSPPVSARIGARWN